MLDLKQREFIALVGSGGLLLTAKVRRARARQLGIRSVCAVASRALIRSTRNSILKPCAHGCWRPLGRSHPLSHHGGRLTGTLASSMALILKVGPTHLGLNRSVISKRWIARRGRWFQRDSEQFRSVPRT
jgi:hypothetical protein